MMVKAIGYTLFVTLQYDIILMFGNVCWHSQARRTQGGCRGCIPPPDLKRCWHDT